MVEITCLYLFLFRAMFPGGMIMQQWTRTGTRDSFTIFLQFVDGTVEREATLGLGMQRFGPKSMWILPGAFASQSCRFLSDKQEPDHQIHRDLTNGAIENFTRPVSMRGCWMVMTRNHIKFTVVTLFMKRDNVFQRWTAHGLTTDIFPLWKGVCVYVSVCETAIGKYKCVRFHFTHLTFSFNLLESLFCLWLPFLEVPWVVSGEDGTDGDSCPQGLTAANIPLSFDSTVCSTCTHHEKYYSINIFL